MAILRKLKQRLLKKDPYEIALKESPRGRALAEFCAEHGIRSFCEIGCNVGSTSKLVAEALPPSAEMHLFDIQSNIDRTRPLVDQVPDKPKVHYYGNTLKLRDNYCWTLTNMVKEGKPRFDYVYIDGAHDLTIDALAFFLLDRLLEVGGHIEFDDYEWTFGSSRTMSSHKWTREWYTPEQIDTPQIGMLVDSLVRTDERYEEVLKDRVWKKLA